MPTTRTINPLHFEDLEPRRFEDLARQLVYDLRDWHAIEAIGRAGADEGIDIRATERVAGEPPADDRVTGDEDGEEVRLFEERVWIIQCKREREIGPTRLEEIVNESVPAGGIPPYGFAIVAASDFSLKSRQRFQAIMNARRVQESFLWGKAELEDQLYQSRHDHLLFAYFGFSLQTRRRSAKTAFSTRLTTKKRLLKALEADGPGERGHTPVLVRDAAALDYPIVLGDGAADDATPRWRYFDVAGHLRVDCLAVIVRQYYAWADVRTEEWDAYRNVDMGVPQHLQRWSVEEQQKQITREEPVRRFYFARVPKLNQAHLYVLGLIPYDRILLVDEIGDVAYPGPHIVVDCTGFDWLFEGCRDRILQGYDFLSDPGFFPSAENRRPFFPEPLPAIPDDEYGRAFDLEGTKGKPSAS